MNNSLVLQTDFGLSDGAVSAMYGVAISVQPDLSIFDLTHDIPQFNIWEASYRLYQTISYWPEGTVFVSVVDPGVGTERLSVVARTKSNHYIVTPDNGTLTHIDHHIGIVEARVIDEEVNRLPKSGESYTFHGRDVYVYTGARLASAKIAYENVGPMVKVDELVRLSIHDAIMENQQINGTIDILDVRFGNLWTNIHKELLRDTGIQYGDQLEVTITHNGSQVYRNNMSFGRSFADSRLGEPLVYVNSVDNLAIALNQGSFAQAYNIRTGSNWKIHLIHSQQEEGEK
ncbi:S-adenosyl-l-methionine hydroxide adenosyltransferase family protein [Virgibacillus halodenitrificans]|uniref:SAM hydrolase/SAM-dependent halogenase family protein n=1 Tax=Virgibacillus halodenitrificans TaxID=1482 RepID=UPI0024C00D71|nr:S-adenosyl-l-methionine hydroxide adenosyltransferase family protein [Virgibacillus halodenitrificans]WHX24819.1 S-adenosyl-l-methionine hydroxide adenosyltransferase family protein [Virgibacillus halodenitrificans]